jgi:hypothetical protein
VCSSSVPYRTPRTIVARTKKEVVEYKLRCSFVHVPVALARE